MLWNKRYSKNGWETIVRYNRAKKAGYLIEAYVLSINALKTVAVTSLESYFLKRKKSRIYIDRLLKHRKDFGDLIQLFKQHKIFDEVVIDEMEQYWKTRNDIFHNFIDGNNDYDEVSEKIKNFSKIYGYIQKTFLSIKIGEVESAR